MKKKKILFIIVVFLLILFGLKFLKNNWILPNKDKNITIEETKEEKQKENKNKLSKNEKEIKDNKKDLNNMKDKKSNNKFNDNNFEKDNVDRRTDIKPIKPGEFPIKYDGGINDKQNGNKLENQDSDKQDNPSNSGKTDKLKNPQNPEKPEKPGKSDRPNKPKPGNPDNPNQDDNPKPDDKPSNDIIEQEDIEKDELGKLLTIFTKNYRVGQGLVFNSKNNNKLPDEAFVGIKKTGENDGKLHKIIWSGNQLEEVKSNKIGKYRLKVEVKDEIIIAEKNFENISFYVDIVIK